jgi:hypothetical protein
MKLNLITILLFVALAGCNNHHTHEETKGQWLPAGRQEFTQAVERQLDGFSRAMMEVHYRYDELYWAGQVQNWEYAHYQLEHIFEAIEKGYERRPEHKISALEFLGAPQNLMQQAIDNRDPELFNRNFFIYKKACMSCHIKEDVAFINIVIPQLRSGATRVE